MTQQEQNGSEQTTEQERMRALWTTAQETHPELALSARQALKALEREAQAEYLLAHHTREDSLDALHLCEAVQALADGLELWVSVNARLWLEREQQGNEFGLHDLYLHSIGHLHALQIRHYEVQSETVAFCRAHTVPLRLQVIPLLLPLPLGELGKH